MKSHLTTLGVLYLIFGVISGVAAFIFYDIATGRGPILNLTSIIFSIPGFRSVLAFLFALTSLPAIVGGAALLLRQAWAKTLIQILGFVNLVNIPLGTMLGIYTIWVLMREEAAKPWDSKSDSEPMPRVFPPYR